MNSLNLNHTSTKESLSLQKTPLEIELKEETAKRVLDVGASSSNVIELKEETAKRVLDVGASSSNVIDPAVDVEVDLQTAPRFCFNFPGYIDQEDAQHAPLSTSPKHQRQQRPTPQKFVVISQNIRHPASQIIIPVQRDPIGDLEEIPIQPQNVVPPTPTEHVTTIIVEEVAPIPKPQPNQDNQPPEQDQATIEEENYASDGEDPATEIIMYPDEEHMEDEQDLTRHNIYNEDEDGSEHPAQHPVDRSGNIRALAEGIKELIRQSRFENLSPQDLRITERKLKECFDLFLSKLDS